MFFFAIITLIVDSLILKFFCIITVNVNESLRCELEHLWNLRFRYCETRIDYMGTCILMGNMSSFRISFNDEWKTNLSKSSSTGKKFLNNNIFIT